MYFNSSKDSAQHLPKFVHVVWASTAFLLISEPGHAQWRFDPTISLGLEYDSNPALSIDPDLDTSVNGYFAAAEAEISHETPISVFVVTPAVQASQYSDFSELDSTDAFLDLRYDYTGQRSEFTFRANYSDESTRTAERSGVDFDVDDPGDIPYDGSGPSLVADKRQRVRLNPRMSYELSPRTRLAVSATHTDASYDARAGRSLTDYQETMGQATIAFNPSERSTFTFNGYVRDNQFNLPDSDFTGYGIFLGLDRSISERSQLRFKVGGDKTEDVSGKDQNSVVGEVSYVHSMERSELLATYQRNIAGNGTGRLSLRNAVSLNFLHDLGVRTTIGFGFRSYQTEGLGSETAQESNRDYFESRALLRRNLSRTIAVELDYYYTYLNRKFQTAYADSHRVNLWLRYSPVR